MLRIRNFVASLVFCCIATVNLVGCQTVGKTLNLDTDLTLAFDVGTDINPDDSNTPAPLFVRFYELKSSDAFAKADFIDLYERDQEILGDKMISKRELKRLTPGENREEEFVLNKDTRYIALFSEFYRYENSKFRIVFPVQANNIFDDKIVINITGNTMSVEEKN